jgi:hypothetical protein
MSYSAKYVRCRCGEGCLEYDYDYDTNTDGCQGQVLVQDPDDPCPRHYCEVHAPPPKSERIAR